MSSSDEARETVRIIACGVFKTALKHLHLEERYPNVKVSFLPSVLHLRPQDLRNFLRKEVESAQQRKEKVICLYGDCFPDIDEFGNEHNITKIPGAYCYELFLAPQRSPAPRVVTRIRRVSAPPAGRRRLTAPSGRSAGEQRVENPRG